MDQKVNKVLTDTETLIDQYKKKIGDITKNLDSIKKFKEQIKKGDKIITIGGIHAKIAEISETTFIIEVEGGNRLKIEKSAVSMENTGLLGQQ